MCCDYSQDNSADSVPEMTWDAGINGGGGYYDKPQADFAYTATVERKGMSLSVSSLKGVR